MSSAQGKKPSVPALRELLISEIDPNPGNPRLVFPQEELDKLAESIANEGVLVPIVVYKKKNRYVLVDGERRFKCARSLGLKKISAVVTEERSEQALLVQMFNIHLIREPWRDIPTALALGRLTKELEAKGGKGSVTVKQLRDLTGLSTERIDRLRYALTLPKEWQEYIQSGDVPLNWFWELQKNVIVPMSKQRSRLFENLGEKNIVSAFVEKRLGGVTGTDTVSLRKIRPIINFAFEDAGQNERTKSTLDDVLRKLVRDPLFTIDEAYEDTVQVMVEIDQLQRRSSSMAANFERLLDKARNATEVAYIKKIGKSLIKKLQAVID